MSTPRPARPAKLVVGLLMKDLSLLDEAAAELQERCGPPDMVSPWLPFPYTNYYEPEMGSPLQRRLIAFRRLVGQDTLARVKQWSNRIEARYSTDGRRRINIDPGYLTLERFVLATGKNFTHRIYIGQGIYADLTLVFTGGRFEPLPWTYPDYAAEPIRRFLGEVRERYRSDLRRHPDAPDPTPGAEGAGRTPGAGKDPS